jgi:glycerol-3-phosphate dehydrogenase
MERTDVAVIGAGLIGSAVGYDLAMAGVNTLVFEAGDEPASGASRSNSGVVHTGFDSEPGTLETEMIQAQAARWRSVFDTLEVPYRVTGALLVATNADEASRLSAMAENADRNGVEVELLDAVAARRLEPRSAAQAGLLVTGEAITDPYEVVRRLLVAGPETRLRWPVEHVKPSGEGVVVSGPVGEVSASFVVNCAGLYADDIAADGSFRILPRRGEFIVFNKGTADLVDRILLPVPNERTKGVLVFPTLYGYLCAGPSAVDQEAKDDWRPRKDGLKFVKEQATKLMPSLKQLEPVDAWAGLRPAGYPRNYMVAWSERVPTLLHVAGIRSTGLSSCLGLSKLVLGLLVERGLELDKGVKSTPPASAAFEGPPRPWWERLNALRGGQA